MGKTRNYSELEQFINQSKVDDPDADRAGRIPGSTAKGEAGARTGKGGPAGESAARPNRSGVGRSIMAGIEERQEAAGLVGRGPGGSSGTFAMPELVDQGGTNMLEILAEQQGMEYVDLGKIHVEEDVIRIFPAEFARENKCLPLRIKDDGTLVVAIADPLNVTIVDNLRLLLEREIEPVVSKEEDIVDLVDKHFSHAEDIDELMEQLKLDAGLAGAHAGNEFNLDPEQAAHAPPVIRLVNLILMRALKDRASDLHIEPFQNSIRVRYRVDGVLRELPPPPKSFQVGLITRFKVMASINISETRRPQDGRIKLTHQGREVDLRVSTLPTVHGESVVMRILDKQMMMIGIDQIGMTKKVLDEFRKICRRPNGVVLVTGPTGCGKTTTLYAAIMDRLDPEEKFITTEDPVEYEVPGLVQVNINAKVGLTFGACLRAILRQDPDIILVGEIRDVETATISIQAALTGHLVFSTLHTNSAAATVTRLIDMGIEPFLLTSTLQTVIGQRLVRSICPSCREVYEPTDDELGEFALRSEEVRGIVFYHGAGCDECNFTGFRGRLGLFEMLAVDDEIKDMILERATSDEINELAVKRGMMTMRQDAFLKVCMGITTIGEVSHHLMAGVHEHVRAEIEPILKQLREKLGGGIGIDSSQGIGKPAAAPGVSDSSIAGLVGSANDIPGDSQWGAPDLTGLPDFTFPSLPGEAAASLHAPAPPPPAAPKLPAPPPLEDDEFSFLSTSAMEERTPFADFSNMEGLSGLDSLDESAIDEEGYPPPSFDLPGLDNDPKRK